jgi:hypothetical protein
VPHRDPWALLRSEETTDRPIDLIWDGAGDLADVLWTTDAVLVLVSDRLAKIFERENLTGWSTWPVTPSSPVAQETWRGLAVTGRKGAVRYYRPDSRPNASRERGGWRMALEPSSYPPFDFSVPDDGAFIIVSERVTQTFKREKVKNVKLTPLADVYVSDALYESTRKASRD